MKHRNSYSLFQGKQVRNQFFSCERLNEGKNRGWKALIWPSDKKSFENNEVSDFLSFLGNAISISKNFLFTPWPFKWGHHQKKCLISRVTSYFRGLREFQSVDLVRSCPYEGKSKQELFANDITCRWIPKHLGISWVYSCAV